MKTKKSNKGLQKLTDSELKIQALFSLSKVKKKDIKTFTDFELSMVGDLITEKMSKATPIEKAKIVFQFDEIFTQSTKNELWENNHNKITFAISDFIQNYGRMPSKSEIGIKAELSRQTVYKHLKEYTNHPLHLDQVEQFKFMTSKVLAKVFQFAVNGDTGAAKLYLTAMGCLNNVQPQASAMIQNQNNFIQINNTILSQETIKNLSADQLQNIESIIKASMVKS